MTAPTVKVMVANKLPATVLAQVFLLVIAGFAVSLYILPTATGTANGILSFHTSNIPCLRCFLFARRLSAYILGHHLNSEHLLARNTTKVWLVYAWDQESGKMVAHVWGKRDLATVMQPKQRLKESGVTYGQIASDNWSAFLKVFQGDVHQVGETAYGWH